MAEKKKWRFCAAGVIAKNIRLQECNVKVTRLENAL